MARKTKSSSRKKRSIKTPYEKILFIPDTHVPYHHHKAFDLAVKVAEAFKPDYLVILGDFADFYGVSSHDRSPERKLNILEEGKEARECLTRLAEASGAKYRIFISGNHEYRLRRYIWSSAPALHGIASVQDILKLRLQPTWEFIPYRQYIMIGKLMVTHDLGSGGMNAHRAGLKHAGSGKSLVIGHTHRMATETIQDTTGQISQTSMFGWLGDRDQIDPYLHKAQTHHWVHGVGIGYKFKDGTVITHPVPFTDGKAVINGSFVEI